MIADNEAPRAQVLAQVLVEAGYEVVALADGSTRLMTLVDESEPDLVLINTDSPSRDTLEQLSGMHADRPRPVVMFASDEGRDTIRAAVRAGVSVYTTQGLDTAQVSPVIEAAIAQFSEYQSVRQELTRTKQVLSERKTLDRAKGILMQRRGCSEPEAFALLRQAAMNHKRRLGEVAEELVEAAGVKDVAAEEGVHA